MNPSSSSTEEYPQDSADIFGLLKRGRHSPEGAAEDAEAAARAGAVNNAFNLLHHPDESMPSEYSSLRQRIDGLTRETVLCKEYVVDRGVSTSRSTPRFTIRQDVLELVKVTIEGTQEVLDLLARAASEDQDSPRQEYRVDPHGSIVLALTNAKSIPAL
ncbi:hypothetical protein EV122DRAFT_226707, partial [Schizophyllum commune]